MQHSCRLSNPAHDDLALAVTEPHNPPGKASRKRFLHLFERQLRQRLAFKRAGPTRKRRRLRARCGRLKTRSHKRHQCRYRTRDYVADVATTHIFLLLNSNTRAMIPAASNTNATTPAYSWPH